MMILHLLLVASISVHLVAGLPLALLITIIIVIPLSLIFLHIKRHLLLDWFHNVALINKILLIQHAFRLDLIWRFVLVGRRLLWFECLIEAYRS